MRGFGFGLPEMAGDEAMSARIISASFSDWRPVKGRKVLQLIFEVPIEQQTEVLTLLGPPGIAEDKWCAIALLNEKPAASGYDTKTQQAPVIAEPPQVHKSKPKHRFSDLSLPEQAGIRCQNEKFHIFLSARFGSLNNIIRDPADFVRNRCGIKSRTELSHNHAAANEWRALESEFQIWLVTQQYADSVR